MSLKIASPQEIQFPLILIISVVNYLQFWKSFNEPQNLMLRWLGNIWQYLSHNWK